MKMKRKLIADVHPGDNIVMEGEKIFVRKVEWATYSPVVIINDEILLNKEDWVVTQ